MRIQHTRHTRQRRGDGKGDQLVFCHIDAHRLGSDPVVTDGHDRTSRSGMNEIQYDKQRDQNQDHPHRKIRVIRCARNALRPLDQHQPVLFHMQRKGVFHGKMNAVTVHTQI